MVAPRAKPIALLAALALLALASSEVLGARAEGSDPWGSPWGGQGGAYEDARIIL